MGTQFPVGDAFNNKTKSYENPYGVLWERNSP